MKESLYIGSSTAIVNFTNEFYQSSEELVASEGFKVFLESYLKNLAVRDIKTFSWITNGTEGLEEIVPAIVTLAKQLLVLDLDEISSPLLNRLNIYKALYIVEDAYNYWRKKQRFSIINANSADLTFSSFIDADTKYSQLVLHLYRTCEEKLQGKKNIVYRQLQAGTNASCVVKNYKWDVNGYSVLKNIPFVNKVMLRTPILFHPACNKRTGTFTEVFDNPVKDFKFKHMDWFCMPLKVNDLLCFVYFHKDYMANGLSIANLFEMASEEECVNHKPDLICLFGYQDDGENCNFYHDVFNDIWVGTVSYHWKAEYFGYIKKAILTLHNLAKMQQGCLPIHGSMMEIYFEDGMKKSLILIGDSGAGKSESIEAIKHISSKSLGTDRVKHIDVIFDDMGSLKIVDGKVVANGTETGAFVRLDDLDQATAYQDMERSIFLNPESNNARVILPIASYEMISTDHEIDMVLYANNYQESVGVEQFKDYSSGKQVFMDGKRMALGTTQEKGLSSTFFANPFGPMQKQELCTEIMEKMFEQLYKDGVYVGQIFTNLGTDHKEDIEQSAQILMELLRK